MPIDDDSPMALFKEALSVFGLGDFGTYFDLDVPLDRKEQFLADLKVRLKSAYRKMLSSEAVHPDKGGSTHAFVAVQQAYEFASKFELARQEMVRCPHCQGMGFIQMLIPVDPQWKVNPNFSPVPSGTSCTP